jgi:hypothetical protein
VVGLVVTDGDCTRFFYAEERSAEGAPMGATPGPESHAKMFLRLAEESEDLPYYITFVDGKYHAFE